MEHADSGQCSNPLIVGEKNRQQFVSSTFLRISESNLQHTNCINCLRKGFGFPSKTGGDGWLPLPAIPRKGGKATLVFASVFWIFDLVWWKILWSKTWQKTRCLAATKPGWLFKYLNIYIYIYIYIMFYIYIHMLSEERWSPTKTWSSNGPQGLIQTSLALGFRFSGRHHPSFGWKSENTNVLCKLKASNCPL